MRRCPPNVRRSPFAFDRACRALAVASAFVLIAANAAFAAESTVQHRFELSGSGTLTRDAPLLRNERLQLKAVLAPAGTISAEPTLLSGGGFQIAGTLSASSLVCYNDTIFRDDFDGDGY